MTEDTLTRRAAELLVEAATAAPSLHNSQPWRFIARLADRVIEIYADPARTLRRGDPRGRAVHIACGSALFDVRLAAAQAGWEPVARLLPCPRDPLLLASVRLAGPYRLRPAERDLYAAIRRPASRRPLRGRPLPRGLISALREAAALEGASLRQPGQADALRILRRSAAADPDLGADPGYLAELTASTGGRRAGGKRATGKVPRNGPPPPGGPGPDPPLAVISTAADDRASWLRAGQAAQRVLLLAAHHGLPAALLSPVLEPPVPPPDGDPVLRGEHPAVILRFGCGWPAPAPGRRAVAQVLRVDPGPNQLTGFPVRA
jgi:nitroreductase